VKLGVSKTTLINWSKDNENEISNLKATELEHYKEKYYMKKEKKYIIRREIIALKKELDREIYQRYHRKLSDLMI